MAPERRVTVALDGYGAEQGFEVLAEGARLAAADPAIGVRVFGPEKRNGGSWNVRPAFAVPLPDPRDPLRVTWRRIYAPFSKHVKLCIRKESGFN